MNSIFYYLLTLFLEGFIKPFLLKNNQLHQGFQLIKGLNFLHLHDFQLQFLKNLII